MLERLFHTRHYRKAVLTRVDFAMQYMYQIHSKYKCKDKRVSLPDLFFSENTDWHALTLSEFSPLL